MVEVCGPVYQTKWMWSKRSLSANWNVLLGLWEDLFSSAQSQDHSRGGQESRGEGWGLTAWTRALGCRKTPSAYGDRPILLKYRAVPSPSLSASGGWEPARGLGAHRVWVHVALPLCGQWGLKAECFHRCCFLFHKIIQSYGDLFKRILRCTH